MKQKTDNKTPVTKDDFVKLEKTLKKGFKKDLKNEFAIYDQKLTNRLLDGHEAFRRELNYQFKIQNENWERRFNALLNQLHSIIDPLLQEIKTRQQGREIVVAQISDVRNTIDNHEKRIKKLEHS
jgi:hypothetical protein